MRLSKQEGLEQLAVSCCSSWTCLRLNSLQSEELPSKSMPFCLFFSLSLLNLQGYRDISGIQLSHGKVASVKENASVPTHSGAWCFVS
jgi:hypothetical protein